MYRLSIRYDDGSIDDDGFASLDEIRAALRMLKRLVIVKPKPIDYVITAHDGQTVEEGPVYDSD